VLLIVVVLLPPFFAHTSQDRTPPFVVTTMLSPYCMRASRVTMAGCMSTLLLLLLRRMHLNGTAWAPDALDNSSYVVCRGQLGVYSYGSVVVPGGR
jgi:hypothetical protein